MDVYWIGRLLFRFRSYTPIPVLVLIVGLLSRSRGYAGPGGDTVDRALNWIGLAVAWFGQALRFYTLGQVTDGTSGQGSRLEATVLNVQGPYAQVRNPLYLGNLGICLGLLLIAHDVSAYALGLGFFFLEYFFIIRAEESFLDERFGQSYRVYKSRVSRWMPTLRPAFSGRLRSGFDFARACKKEHNPFATWGTSAIVLLGWEGVARSGLGRYGLGGLVLAELLVLSLYMGIKAYKHGLLLRRPAG